MLTTDLREWLDKVDEMGELKRIEGADWDLEIGCITAMGWGKTTTPALLFDNIKGYPTGDRVVTNFLSSPNRVALTLGLPSDCSLKEHVEILRQKLPQWEAGSHDFPPKVVTSGHILENVRSGDEVDLLQFPVPKCHEHDGGRYIGTGDAVITRDPDTGEVNLGTYRIMVHDAQTVGFYISPGKHGRIHYEKYHAMGKPCPVALSIGHHPLIFGVAGTETSGPEYNFAGAIRGQPVEVIEEEITGLPIPADSELVIVGWCPPGKTRVEGPFGEWTGYYASKERPTPVLEVERIYHRNNPIILGCPPGRPPTSNAYFRALIRSAMLYNFLVNSGIPDIRGVWLSPEGVSRLLLVISIKQRYAGHAKQAAIFASQSRIGAYMGRYVIVVDEDIDPTNIQDVLWALFTRSDPEKDIDIIRRAWASSLDPTIRKPTKAYFNSRAIIDACKPYEWIDEFPETIAISPELAERVKQKWGSTLEL